MTQSYAAGRVTGAGTVGGAIGNTFNAFTATDVYWNISCTTRAGRVVPTR